MNVLQVENVHVHFPIRGGVLRSVIDHVRAVDGVSFALQAGETYGLVGESGSGKSTIGKAIMRLHQVTSGRILLQGKDVSHVSKRESMSFRQDIQMIFQDPYASLNPKKRILDIVAEPLRNFHRLSVTEERRIVQAYLEKVHLSPDSLYKYPHEFSGGQRQRIGIARALTLKPKIIIADEPVSALDVSVQAQVLNVLQDLQKECHLTYLFISHDLGVIRHMCDRIGVMYRGRLVEEGRNEDIYERPQHMYTKRLMAAIPDLEPSIREQKALLRKKVAEEYERTYRLFFDETGRVYDLKALTATHKVALP